jgi:hypothetical protein
MFKFIKALESKVEAVEAERKKDLEKAEAERKKDLKKAELKIEAVEAERKKDLKKAELKIEAVEAQRKKDLKKAELKIEAVEAQMEKLKLDLEEQKQADEATKRYIESIAENVDATNDFLAVGVCLLSIHSLNFISHIHFYSRTRRRWIKSSVETFLTVLKHLLRCYLVWAATPATHLLTLEMHLVIHCLSRNGNNVSLRYLQRRKMRFRRRLLP